ncbi:hypothetical protein RQP46_009061 [Phenoliferia psychrophenolica]
MEETPTSPLPTEIMLMIVKCAYANDRERQAWSDGAAADQDRLSSLAPTPGLHRTAYEAIVFQLSHQPHKNVPEAEFTDEGSEDAESSSEGSNSDEAVALDPAWIGKSVQALSLVNRHWNLLTAEFRFSETLKTRELNGFLRNVLSKGLARHFKQIDLRMAGTDQTDFAHLSTIILMSPNIVSLLVDGSTFDEDVVSRNDLILVLDLLEGRIKQLVHVDQDPLDLLQLTWLDTPEVKRVTRLDIPRILPFYDGDEEDLDAAGIWAAVLEHFPNLEDLVIGIDGSDGCQHSLWQAERRAVLFSHPHLIHSEPRGDHVGVRTTIDFGVARQLLECDFEHVEALHASLWSLSIGSRKGIEGHDPLEYDLEPCRLAIANFPLAGPFPKLAHLTLINIETRTEDEIADSQRAWEVSAELAEEVGEASKAPRPFDLEGSDESPYEDGTPRLPQINSDAYLLLLSSFDSSPLTSISLIGPHLSVILAHQGFLPFLSLHLGTLHQIIIDSGDTSEDSDAYFELDKFCTENSVHLAFTGSLLCAADPPVVAGEDQVTPPTTEELEKLKEEVEMKHAENMVGLVDTFRGWS